MMDFCVVSDLRNVVDFLYATVCRIEMDDLATSLIMCSAVGLVVINSNN